MEMETEQEWPHQRPTIVSQRTPSAHDIVAPAVVNILDPNHRHQRSVALKSRDSDNISTSNPTHRCGAFMSHQVDLRYLGISSAISESGDLTTPNEPFQHTCSARYTCHRRKRWIDMALQVIYPAPQPPMLAPLLQLGCLFQNNPSYDMRNARAAEQLI